MIERWYKAPVDCVFDVTLAKMPAGLFRAWHQMMALASLNGGALPAVEQIAYSLRSSAATIVKRLEALAARRLATLTGQTWRLVDPAAGEAGETEAPASAAERTRRWRERKAAYAAAGDAPDAGAGGARSSARDMDQPRRARMGALGPALAMRQGHEPTNRQPQRLAIPCTDAARRSRSKNLIFYNIYSAVINSR